ncbi:MAG: inositol monophosphatase [Dehalococcoidia bacterium]|nr:inositol monophosphatase [Dehalococcoidia bacterium]
MSTVPLPLSRMNKTAMEVATTAALKAGQVLTEKFSIVKTFQSKGRGNVVSEADFAADKVLKQLFIDQYPDFGILSEESEAVKGTTEYQWIIDPLDGSRNYVSGVPHFAVNIALVRGKEILLGLTYDPSRKEIFTSVKGNGTYLNGKQVWVGKAASLRDSVVGLDMGYNDARGKEALRLLIDLWPGMQSIRIMGSAALGMAYVASGRLDVYFHHNLYPWDVAPGILMIQEAGGVITDRNGNPMTFEIGNLISANKAVHNDFLCLTEGSGWRKA